MRSPWHWWSGWLVMRNPIPRGRPDEVRYGDLMATEAARHHTLIADFVGALTLLQTRVPFVVCIPNLDDFTIKEASKIIDIARIIKGPVTALHDQPLWFCSQEGNVRTTTSFGLLIEQQVTWRWDGQEADIGTMYTAGWHLTSELAHREGHEDHDDYKIIPIKGTTWSASFDRTALEATAPGRLDIEPQR
jgi:hypothetical protein